MKKTICWLGAISIVVFACNLPTATVSGTPSEESATPTTSPLATDTLTMAPPATNTPTATLAPSATPNVACNEITLDLDPSLASGFQCQTIPAAGGPDDPSFAINPQYTEVTFQGYSLADTFHTPHISVFPVQQYRELLPGMIDEKVAALRALIAGGSLPATGGLPLLPVFNANEEFRTHYKVTSFSNGNGIRYLTQYAQFYDPINSQDMFYSFQGLSADGKYWISAILPISNSMLPPNGDNPPAGMTWDQFGNQFNAYIADIITKLEAQPPETYMPTIATLDALIGSITIHP